MIFLNFREKQQTEQLHEEILIYINFQEMYEWFRVFSLNTLFCVCQKEAN